MWIFGCSGADPQDVLSNTIGTSTTTASSSGTSGTSSGNTTSSSSSGSSGTTSSTSSSSGDPGDGCVAEGPDSTQDAPIKFTTCAGGTLTIPNDQEDWVTFEMPKNHGFNEKFSGPVALTFYDSEGRAYNTVKDVPNKEGQYFIQIQYDFQHNPIAGTKPTSLTFPWSVTIAFTE